jgi:hypothetical protein
MTIAWIVQQLAVNALSSAETFPEQPCNDFA